jgi:GlpG protein
MRAAEINYVGPIPLPNSILKNPASFGLVAVSALVFLLFYQLRIVSLLQLFNFVPFEVTAAGTQFDKPGDWWRFITPALLHFSWMHLVFNSLWIWEFGRRIESRIGSLNLLGLFFVAAIFSNSVQYLASGPSVFGGMSGVVYAFLGFIFAGNLLRPNWLEPVPAGLMIFMLIWLFIGLTGTLSFLGMGAIANGAHFGGLVVGFILGGVIGLISRMGKR